MWSEKIEIILERLAKEHEQYVQLKNGEKQSNRNAMKTFSFAKARLGNCYSWGQNNSKS